MTENVDDQSLRGGLKWLTESEVASLVDLNDAMTALRNGFIEEARGTATAIDKSLGAWPAGAMQSLGSMMPRLHYAGFKTWVHTSRGATAIFSLFDMRDGRLLAVLEAATLGQIRTSAVSGLAVDVLAEADVDEMAIVGTGAQALTQIAAVAAVRPLSRLRVYSPTAENRHAFVEKARARFPFDVVECDSLDRAVAGAPIVTLITRTTEPFLNADMLSPAALLIAAGAILPAAAECRPDVLAATGLFVVDSLGNAQRNSRELREHFGTSTKSWLNVRTLGAILSDGTPPTDPAKLKFFKPMGSGLSDLSVAIMAYERAIEREVGIGIEQPVRVMPRWRLAAPAN